VFCCSDVKRSSYDLNLHVFIHVDAKPYFCRHFQVDLEQLKRPSAGVFLCFMWLTVGAYLGCFDTLLICVLANLLLL